MNERLQTELQDSDEDDYMQMQGLLNPKKQLLLNDLLQMQLSLKRALLILYISGCDNFPQVFEFIITDENGLYNHPFCEDYETNICLICETEIDKHKNVNDYFATDDEHYNFIKRASESELFKLVKFGLTPQSAIIYTNQKPSEICTICYDAKYSVEMLKLHDKIHTICLKCFRDYLYVEIVQNNKVIRLKCPECNTILTQDEIKTYTSANTYAKYLNFLRNHEINTNPLKKWCPNPQCNEIITLNTRSDQIASCEKCGLEICTNCNRKVHEGISCDENIDNDLKQWSTNRDVQKCPKCNMLVEKIQGCNHMTCQVCLYEWCWLCKSTYTSIHFSPYNPFGCPGLQAENHKAERWSTTRLIFRRLGLFILLLIALPLLLICASPIYLTKKLVESSFFREKIRSISCCWKILLILVVFMIGTFLNIIVLPVLLLAVIPAGFILIYRYCKQRMTMLNRHYNALELMKRTEKLENMHSAANDNLIEMTPISDIMNPGKEDSDSPIMRSTTLDDLRIDIPGNPLLS